MIDTIKEYWPILVVLGSVFSSWVAWSAKKQFVSPAALNEVKTSLDTRVGGVENKVTVLEKDLAIVKSQLDGLPTKDDLHRIEVAVTKVSGELKAVSATQTGLVRNIHLFIKSQIEEDT